MLHLWKSTYNESMGEFFNKKLSQFECDIFNMLWCSFRLTYLTKSELFENIILGDGKYTLWVKKLNGILYVKFIRK